MFGAREILKRGVDKSRDSITWRRTYELIHNFSALKHQESRNAHDIVGLGQVLVGIYVDFENLRLANVLGGKLLDRRTDGFARSAPSRPKIDQNGNFGFQNIFFKFGRSYGKVSSHSYKLLLSSERYTRAASERLGQGL